MLSPMQCVISSSILAAFGQILLKLGAHERSTPFEFINIQIICGLAALMAGAGLWVIALSNLRLMQVYPFTALTFILVYITGYLFLGEHASWRGWIGVTLILIGLLLISADGATP